MSEDSKKWTPNYFSWIPDGILKENLDIRYIGDVLNSDFALLTARVTQWRLNINPQTCDQQGIKEYEDWLGLMSSPVVPLENRIEQVIIQLNKTLPYTWIRLHRMLGAVVGWDNFELSREGARITSKIKGESVSLVDSVDALFREVVPMNLWWDIRQLFDMDETPASLYPFQGQSWLISSVTPYIDDGRRRFPQSVFHNRATLAAVRKGEKVSFIPEGLRPAYVFALGVSNGKTTKGLATPVIEGDGVRPIYSFSLLGSALGVSGRTVTPVIRDNKLRPSPAVYKATVGGKITEKETVGFVEEGLRPLREFCLIGVSTWSNGKAVTYLAEDNSLRPLYIIGVVGIGSNETVSETTCLYEDRTPRPFYVFGLAKAALNAVKKVSVASVPEYARPTHAFCLTGAFVCAKTKLVTPICPDNVRS